MKNNPPHLYPRFTEGYPPWPPRKNPVPPPRRTKKTDVLRASLEKAGQVQRDDGTPLQPGLTHTVVDTDQGEMLVRRRFSALKEKPSA